MRRWIGHLLTLVSLLLLIASTALYLRAVRHFEMIDLRYNRWPRTDELRSIYASFSWYSVQWVTGPTSPWYTATLRLEIVYLPVHAEHGKRLSDWPERWLPDHPPGARIGFVGEETTGLMNGFDAGFHAAHYPFSYGPAAAGDRIILATRAWLPPIVFAILPTARLVRIYRNRRARNLNLCPTCGYDLRASPERCPECGTARDPMSHISPHRR